MRAGQEIRKAALVASVMTPAVRTRLFASLDPATADAMAAAVIEIERRGWNRREIVESALKEPEACAHPDDGIGAETLCGLAAHVDSVTFSRILAASGGQVDDFLMTVLGRQYAVEVREQMQSMPEMPERLRVATMSAAASMLEDLRGRA